MGILAADMKSSAITAATLTVLLSIPWERESVYV